MTNLSQNGEGLVLACFGHVATLADARKASADDQNIQGFSSHGRLHFTYQTPQR